jgi:hypothetical protein
MTTLVFSVNAALSSIHRKVSDLSTCSSRISHDAFETHSNSSKFNFQSAPVLLANDPSSGASGG